MALDTAAVFQMVNEIPLELICVIAHESDAPVEQDRALELLSYFPDDRYFAQKQEICQNPALALAFVQALNLILGAARRYTSYLGKPHEFIVVDSHGVTWRYGRYRTVFPEPDAEQLEHARDRVKAMHGYALHIFPGQE